MKEIFQEEKFKEEFVVELTTSSKDLIIDYAEIGLDVIFEDDLIKEIPVLKTIAAACKVGMVIRDRHFAKKIAVFIKQFHEGNVNPEKLEQFKLKIESDYKYRDKVVDHIIVMIDRYIDSEKSKIMARMLTGYIYELCTLEQFIEMTSCLDLVFLSDCTILIDIYNKTKELTPDSSNIFIDFEDGISGEIFSSIGRLRANGLISGRRVARYGGGPENKLDVESQITNFGTLFCELGLL